jgi:GGDEF domain-containing protein
LWGYASASAGIFFNFTSYFGTLPADLQGLNCGEAKMPDLEQRRVLLTAEAAAGPSLLDLFGKGPLQGWQALAADSFEQARFTLRHRFCDVLAVDETLYDAKNAEGFAWLTRHHQVPMLLLSRMEPGMAAYAMEHGATQWLPYDLAVQHPALLAGALNQVAQINDLRRRIDQVKAKLNDSRRQVDRMVGVLWRSLPTDSERRWFTHRHMLERLHEEVNRTRRYGNPLTVVLGEVPELPAGPSDFAGGWLAEQVMKSKRSCDVAGQYGPHGFMLLLVHTPETGGAVYCRRLQKVLGQQTPAGGSGVSGLRAYFGLAGDTAAESTSERLLSQAEQNLEAAKTAGERLEAAV